MTGNASGVPNPTSLLAIQAGGGFLALIGILTIGRGAKLERPLNLTIRSLGIFNLVLSLGLLWAYQSYPALFGQIGELLFCRIAIFYDIIMLGMLVYSTGGSEQSVFAPQFAAVLPVAVLIHDSAVTKWAYAGAFLLMFIVGLSPTALFVQYLDTPEAKLWKRQWFLICFFLFALFPVVYSIMAEP